MTSPVFSQIHPSKRIYSNKACLRFDDSTRMRIYSTIVHPIVTHDQWWRSDIYLMFITAEPVLQRLLQETT